MMNKKQKNKLAPKKSERINYALKVIENQVVIKSA